ncbi:MAG: pantetheine-phosphate adenylyltransferase [Candidatus Thermoplasmatota archaeon]|nr:pantetheine-phosphate adenylyltransferase [Candidatus Thermoplasmatota archaeon]
MRYGRVCLGGTFSPLHAGHMRLLEEAFSRSEHVSIGLTSDDMAEKSRSRSVAPYEDRCRELSEKCNGLSEAYGSECDIRMIEDAMGFALEIDIEAILVSEETLPGALRINEVRMALGLTPLEVISIPMVRMSDGRRISSTLIVQEANAGNGQIEGGEWR